MTPISRRTALASAASLTLLSLGKASLAAGYEDVWPDLQGDIFGARPVKATDGLLVLEAPYRAEDAAIVPMTLRIDQKPGDTRQVRKITLVIDRNPAPVAAEFEIGPNSGVVSIETRVRVNEYTKVHAVAELADGTLHMAEAFVKAAGGCSAPAAKAAAEALANLGKVKLRQFPAAAGQSGLREAQLMIRHPNHSGLAKDQVTLLYVPARFVDDLTLKQGDDLLFRMTGGISISEDPAFRFSYRPNGADKFTLDFRDTDGASFAAEWPVEPAAT